MASQVTSLPSIFNQQPSNLMNDLSSLNMYGLPNAPSGGSSLLPNNLMGGNSPIDNLMPTLSGDIGSILNKGSAGGGDFFNWDNLMGGGENGGTGLLPLGVGALSSLFNYKLSSEALDANKDAQAWQQGAWQKDYDARSKDYNRQVADTINSRNVGAGSEKGKNLSTEDYIGKYSIT